VNEIGEPTLVIFSGLPGTGKSTLADCLARKFCWPSLRIDDFAGDNIPEDADFRFWDEKILLLLQIAEEQLKLGVSVIADSIFMGTDRIHAQEIAKKHSVTFRPIYCYLSDEALWEKRVVERAKQYHDIDVATWKQIQHQRQWFSPWQSGTGLFIDAVNSVEQNFAEVLEFVTNPTTSIEPLEAQSPLINLMYHE
jgi:predicted kinase